SGEARSMVRLAKRLQHLPETAAAFADGNISRAHAVVIARAHTPERLHALEPFEHIFANAAREVDTDDLRNVIRNVTDAVDGDGGAASDDEIYAKRSLYSSKTMETASVPDDSRTLQQRRADALVDICRLSLASDHH